MITVNQCNTFSYTSIGEFLSNGIWIHPQRVIDSYELIFVTKGVVYIEEAGIRYELTSNQMLILEPGKTHGGYKESTAETSFYWFHYKTDLPLPFKLYTGTDYYEIKYALKKLLHIANSPSYPELAKDAFALTIYEELMKTGREELSINPVIAKIAEYIRINIRSNPTVASVADEYGYNPDYVSKIFKQAYGITIKEYIIGLKMNMAKDYLMTTEFSVKQIAAELGFEDENLFVKFFVYHEKLSPTVFRNRLYNTHMNNK